MNFYKILVSVILVITFQVSSAQIINWNGAKNSSHLINASIGWDYSVSYSIGYSYRVKSEIPIYVSANFSMPSGEDLLNDFKTKIGAQVLLLDKQNIKGSVVLNGIYRRYENPLVRLQNFGSELKGVFGYYKSGWFVAGEMGFDKAIVTHFQHSEIYKDNIYPDVEDGWYEPSTGGNFNYGLLGGYSFRYSDITLNLGMLKTQDFKTNPLIPFYINLGYNYKFK